MNQAVAAVGDRRCVDCADRLRTAITEGCYRLFEQRCGLFRDSDAKYETCRRDAVLAAGEQKSVRRARGTHSGAVKFNPRFDFHNSINSRSMNLQSSGMWRQRPAGLRLFELLHQHFRIATARVVFLAAGGGQIVRRAFRETALGLEVRESLRGKREQFGQAQLARLALDKLD